MKALAAVKGFLDGKGLFETHELVTIGLFAAGSRAATLMIALVGGGMNPVTMILRSAVHAALLVVLLSKVPRTGALTLFNLLGAVLAFFLMGQGMLSIPAMVAGTLLVEFLFRGLGGLERHPGYAIPMVALSELFIRFVNMAVSYLAVREQPGLLVFVVVISAFSYLGILAGLPCGWRMTRELRHAGLIQYGAREEARMAAAAAAGAASASLANAAKAANAAMAEEAEEGEAAAGAGAGDAGANAGKAGTAGTEAA